MNELLNKKNRIIDSLTNKGIRERKFYIILSCIAFVLGAFTMFEFVNEFCNFIGSIISGSVNEAFKQFFRMLPMWITTASYIVIGVFVNNAYTAESFEQRKKIWKKSSFAVMIMGLFIFFYIIMGSIFKIYSSLVESSISWLFPLDLAIGGLMIAAFGFFGYKYYLVLEKKPSELPYHNAPKCKWLINVLGTISYLIGSFGFSAFIYGIFIMDWNHDYIFFNIMLMLTYLSSFLMLAAYRFGYVELKPSMKRVGQFKWSWFIIIINVFICALYFLAVLVEPDAQNANATGLLPIEFTLHFNAFMIIVDLNNLLAPLLSLIFAGVKVRQNDDVVRF